MIINIEEVCISRDKKRILTDVNFHAEEGEFIYLTGKVGTGKSSFLKALYAEVPIESGSARILDYNLRKIKKHQIQELRRELGIIFQDFQLLSDRTVYENLNFVLKSLKWKKQARKQRIEESLEKVGMADRMDSFPHELSGGEAQRVSIARALLNDPKIVLADEPTGNLDKESETVIMEILRKISEQGATVIMSTHNLSLLEDYPGVVYVCENGKLEEQINS